MIGLSATPFRDDKLEKVIKWYIGDIIYYEEAKVNQDIIVNIYKFNMEHELYKVVYNKFTKEVQIATMISNLVELKERNNFIRDIIVKTRKNKDRKILVLSERIVHLEYLKEKIDELNIGSTSFYIGGMKQKKLDESEKADVIFSTYSMSSEALDIDTLNTIILATSRRKVEQSVGRILRKQKGNYKVKPLIIDIVDKLDTFTKQSYTRKKYYKKITNDDDIHVFKYNNGKITSEAKKKKIINKEDDGLFIDSD